MKIADNGSLVSVKRNTTNVILKDDAIEVFSMLSLMRRIIYKGLHLGYVYGLI